jgi:hypothetical protein
VRGGAWSKDSIHRPTTEVKAHLEKISNHVFRSKRHKRHVRERQDRGA